jgi:hypothetical protein
MEIIPARAQRSLEIASSSNKYENNESAFRMGRAFLFGKKGGWVEIEFGEHQDI